MYNLKEMVDACKGYVTSSRTINGRDYTITSRLPGLAQLLNRVSDADYLSVFEQAEPMANIVG